MLTSWPPHSYLSALLLEEFGVNLLADDLGANVILDSNAKPHLFQDELHLLLFLHGAICLHLSRKNKYSTLFKQQAINLLHSLSLNIFHLSPQQLYMFLHCKN